ncbi:MAG: outer membrane protein assembly factor BamA [Myxococcota bacterium]
MAVARVLGLALACAGLLAAAAFAQEPAAPPVDLAVPAAPPADPLAQEAQADAAVATEAELRATGAVVQDVLVEGTRRIEPDAIKAVIGTKVGEAFEQGRISEDVRRIYGLGFFHDVRVDVARAANGGAVVTYVVEENPVIRQVSITGNEELGSDDIKEKLTVTVGSTVDYPLLLENSARIEAQYQAKGYYLAKVKYVLEPMGEGSVGVNFDVVEGKKLRLTEIDFRGNEALSDSQLEKVMQTKTWSLTSYVSQLWDSSGLYAEPIFYQDLDKIQRLYMDDGYIRVAIGEPQVEVKEDGLTVAVDIIEGPQFLVGTVDILGDETMDREQLFGLVELEPGEVFSRSTLSADVDRLRGYYADRGFFDASVAPITNVDPEKKEIATQFEVKKGELYFVEGIDVNGNMRTADTVVRRQLAIGEGELYSAQAIALSKRRVQRLGYFEEVEVQAKPTDVPNRVAMSVDVVERPTGSFSFGAGVGSVDGFIVSGSITQENLFGTGRSLSAGVDMGSQNHNYFIRFVEPYVMGSAASLSLTVNSAESEFNDFSEEQTGFSLSVGYPLDEGETFANTGYAFASRSVSGFEQFQAASLLEREEFQGDTTTSLVNLSLRRDTRDDIRFPKSGHITGFNVDFAGLGGFSEFLRLEGRTTHFIPLGNWLPFESTFVFNSRVGYAIPWNDIEDYDLPPCTGGCATVVAFLPSEIRALGDIDRDLELPLTERYFLGGLGAFQVRGFEQRSLGPRRTILEQATSPSVLPSVAFAPYGFSLAEPSLCRFGPGQCNSLDDTEIDDFDNLDATDVIGGNSMALVNLELQFPISEEMGLSGMLFLDMGNAFAENDFINPADFRFGTGFGIQWFSPFGPILVVLGFPLDPYEDEDGSVFEFSLGGQNY